ncbi:MAG: SigE family RNA polymerase sigma factor [Microthrixaceae bacterium]
MQQHQQSGGVGKSSGAADYGEFFASEQNALVRFCWGLTTDREDARDVAQEAMVRAWRDWDQISAEGSNPVAWTRTVALNLVRGGWRRSKVAEAGLARMQAGEYRRNDPRAEGVDVDLERALAGLPQRQREAVVLHHLVDLAVTECAAAMGVSESTVKVHLSRGRAALATSLRVDPESGEPADGNSTEVPR